MKAELSQVRFIHPVTSLNLDVNTRTQKHFSITLDGEVVTVRNSTPGHGFPEVHVPLSNVAMFVVKPAEPKKSEAKK